MAETQDTEITLGTGRILGLFFGLVVVCAIFFGLGFSLGRNSVKAGALNMEETPASVPAQQTSTAKSLAGTPDKPASAATEQASAAPPTTSATDQPSAPTPVVTSPASATPATTTPAPEMSKSAPLAPGSGAYSVQVAAVSKQEDADALVDALKKKSYPVYVATAGTDKLFHVQVGPFGDIKDAEAMKSKLLGDGYNPILKR